MFLWLHTIKVYFFVLALELNQAFKWQIMQAEGLSLLSTLRYLHLQSVCSMEWHDLELCLHSIDQNSIIWPHLSCTVGWVGEMHPWFAQILSHQLAISASLCFPQNVAMWVKMHNRWKFLLEEEVWHKSGLFSSKKPCCLL